MTESEPSKVVALATRYAASGVACKRAVIRLAAAKRELAEAEKAEAQAIEDNERVRKELAALVISLS